MANEKYYYLRLKDSFFDGEAIQRLEDIENGYEFICILLKMQLKSLKDGGVTNFRGFQSYQLIDLGLTDRHSVDVLEQAIKAFLDLGIVEMSDNDSIRLSGIQHLIGLSSKDADRKKRYRAKIGQIANLDTGQMSHPDAGQMSHPGGAYVHNSHPDTGQMSHPGGTPGQMSHPDTGQMSHPGGAYVHNSHPDTGQMSHLAGKSAGQMSHFTTANNQKPFSIAGFEVLNKNREENSTNSPPTPPVLLNNNIYNKQSVRARAREDTKKPPLNPVFSKPEVFEVIAYCLERQNGVDPFVFYNHYQANGWKVGKVKMRDWQAAVRKWERADYKNPVYNAGWVDVPNADKTGTDLLIDYKKAL